MNKKVVTGFMLAVTLLVLAGVTACNAAGGQAAVRQPVAVTRGDITISVSGSGKIEASHESRLTFGSTGKVEKILVKEGEGVETGDILARLDTSALELALAQSQLSVTQAEVALTQAQLAQKTAEASLKSIRDNEDTLNLALLNAQIARDQAQRSLDAGITAVDYDVVRAELNKAQARYDYVLEAIKNSGVANVDWGLELQLAQDRLDTAQANYDNTLAGYNTQDVAIKKKQVAAADMAVAKAQQDLNDLADTITIQELQVTSADQSVVQYQQSVALTRQSLAEAQRQLDEATIIAPFDGMVASVMVKEGDIVPSPSMVPQTIIYMIDPNLMELVVDVDEIDIPRLVLGQTAVVALDALPGKDFQGTVTAIYPVPKEEGGVVLYETRLSLDIPEGSGIKVGMSASADVLIEKRSGVLVVPSRAIQKDSQGRVIVRVMAGKEVQERPVVVGLDDGLRAEIISGLNEGETVVVEARTNSTQLGVF